MSKRKRMPRKRYAALVRQYNKATIAFSEARSILEEQLSEQGKANLENHNCFMVTHGNWPEDLDEAIEIYEDDECSEVY
tara:strand:+ start:361 stop:597 length:237 start_codon:yes stop_codon:yes gene_type:complete